MAVLYINTKGPYPKIWLLISNQYKHFSLFHLWPRTRLLSLFLFPFSFPSQDLPSGQRWKPHVWGLTPKSRAVSKGRGQTGPTHAAISRWHQGYTMGINPSQMAAHFPLKGCRYFRLILMGEQQQQCYACSNNNSAHKNSLCIDMWILISNRSKICMDTIYFLYWTQVFFSFVLFYGTG